MAELAKAPDPANFAMELIRTAQGKRPAVQETATLTGPRPGGQGAGAGHDRLARTSRPRTGVRARRHAEAFGERPARQPIAGTGVGHGERRAPLARIRAGVMTALAMSLSRDLRPTLADIARELGAWDARVVGDANVRPTGVRQDSRKIEAGDLFCARSGRQGERRRLRGRRREARRGGAHGPSAESKPVVGVPLSSSATSGGRARSRRSSCTGGRAARSRRRRDRHERKDDDRDPRRARSRRARSEAWPARNARL
jgi:hypothetical protein